MIEDVTGIILTPSDGGENCLGNGEHADKNNNLIECCCDECDYYLLCFPKLKVKEKSTDDCRNCQNKKFQQIFPFTP